MVPIFPFFFAAYSIFSRKANDEEDLDASSPPTKATSGQSPSAEESSKELKSHALALDADEGGSSAITVVHVSTTVDEEVVARPSSARKSSQSFETVIIIDDATSAPLSSPQVSQPTDLPPTAAADADGSETIEAVPPSPAPTANGDNRAPPGLAMEKRSSIRVAAAFAAYDKALDAVFATPTATPENETTTVSLLSPASVPDVPDAFKEEDFASDNPWESKYWWQRQVLFAANINSACSHDGSSAMAVVKSSASRANYCSAAPRVLLLDYHTTDAIDKGAFAPNSTITTIATAKKEVIARLATTQALYHSPPNTDYSKDCWWHQILFKASINYTCFEVANRMGFAKQATDLLNQAASDVSLMETVFLEKKTAVASEDKETIKKISEEIKNARKAWVPCLKQTDFGFIEDKVSLVYAVSFTLSLAAGMLPFNAQTRRLFIRSCAVIEDFTTKFCLAVRNWDGLATTPLGMAPFAIVEVCMSAALDKIALLDKDKIEYENTLLFEQREKERLSKAVRGLKEAVLAASLLLIKEFEVEPYQFLDISWMDSMKATEHIPSNNQEEADIAVFMAACAGGADVASDDFAGGDGDGRAGHGQSTFGFNLGADFAHASRANSKPSRRPSKGKKASKCGPASKAAKSAAPAPGPAPAAACPAFSFSASAKMSGENAAPAFTFGS